MRRPVIGIAVLALVSMGLVGEARAKTRRPNPDLDQPEFAHFSAGDTPFAGEFQVAAFNIERGFHTPEVIAYLKGLQQQNPALIVLLSECDKNHSRTGDRFIAQEIAEAVQMDMVFVVEYVELNDRTPATPGTHGNAILSPFPLSDISVIRHTEMFSWERWGWVFGQPRKGGVVALGATVNFPAGDKARVYSLHLESNTGQHGRKIQLQDLAPEMKQTDLPLVLGGDFNSLPHSAPFRAAKADGLSNAFSRDCTPTGWCYFTNPKKESLHCLFKIDWILYRGLEELAREVAPLLAADGSRVSDHAAVQARFKLINPKPASPVSPASEDRLERN